MDDGPARRQYRVLLRTRGGHHGSTLYDVQLQVITTRQLLWSQTFGDQDQAGRFHSDVESDLSDLDVTAFRRKYGVSASA